MIRTAEAQKYEQAWSLPGYATHSPGVQWAELFGEIAQPGPNQTVYDLGCGNGAGGKALAERYGLAAAYVDHVRVEGVPEPFIEQCLWDDLISRWDGPFWYGYCCDVLEHIPPQFTMLAARRMLEACDQVFFSVSFRPDSFGAFIGQPLHLTVQPFSWWRDALAEVGELLEARDLLGEGVFLVRGR